MGLTKMRLVPVLIGTLMVAAFWSGCLGSASKASISSAADHPSMAGMDHMAMDMDGQMHMDLDLIKDFRLEYKSCREAGGVSLYDMDPKGRPGPTHNFTLHSIQDDTGNPMFMSYGNPNRMGGSSGIWHIALACDHVIYRGQDLGAFEGGWVGQRINPPAWDMSGIQRQYMVADLSFNQNSVVELIHEATGLHASRNLDAKVDIMPGGAMHTILDDEDHGVFETHGKMKDWTPKDTMDTIRFWMLIDPHGSGHQHGGSSSSPTSPTGGGSASNPACECIPIAFDLHNTGGKYQVIDGTGWLSHTRTDAHGATPGAAGNVGGMAFTGFDRTFSFGEIPDLTVDQTWLH